MKISDVRATRVGLGLAVAMLMAIVAGTGLPVLQGVAPALAQSVPPYDIRPENALHSLDVGDSRMVALRLDPGPQDLFGAQLDFAYDPSVLEIVGFENGPLLAGNGQPDQPGGHFSDAQIDNFQGEAVFVVTLLDPAPAVDVNSAAELARVTFRCVAVGRSTLTMPQTILSTRAEQEIPSSGRTALVACDQAEAVPGVVSWGLGIMIALLLTVFLWALRRRSSITPPPPAF